VPNDDGSHTNPSVHIPVTLAQKKAVKMNVQRQQSRQFPARFIGLVLALLLGPSVVQGQQQAALPLDALLSPLQAGVTGAAVLNSIRGRCLEFRVDDPSVQQRLLQAGADTAFLTELRSFCQPTVEPPVPLLSPSSAAVRSVIPGLGQFYTDRPVVGAAFMVAAGGALAAGVLSKDVTVFCASRASGSCPAEHVVVEESKSKLTLGVAGFAAVAAVAAIDAYLAAGRVNRARSETRSGRENSPTPSVMIPAVFVTHGAVRLELIRLRF
jgi:hypothetical protein